MPRVRSNPVRLKRKKQIMKARARCLRRAQQDVEGREGDRRAWLALCLPRSQEQEARVPSPLDHAYQRRGPSARHVVQRVHQWPREVGDREWIARSSRNWL
jgi:hypothetical protein